MIYIASAIYFPLSILCLKYPSLLGHKSCLPSRRKLIAHRGGSLQALQNTLAAFRHAVLKGADILETDVCLTKDKQVVVHHDLTLVRTCGLQNSLSQLNFSQLPMFAPQVQVHFSEQTRKSAGERIPLLKELLEAEPTSIINIEVKDKTREAVDKTAEVILSCKAESRVIWGSTDNSLKKHMKASYAMPVFASPYDYLKVHLAFIVGLLPFVSLDFDYFQIPLYSEGHYRFNISRATSFKQKFVIELRFGLVKLLNLLDRPVIEHLKKRGIPTYYWVCNKEDEYRRALQAGAMGVMTDRPSELALYLSKCSWLQ